MKCIECGEIIPDGRVKAIPGVLHCVECQELLEKSGQFEIYRANIIPVIATGGEIEDINIKLVKGKVTKDESDPISEDYSRSRK